MAKKSSGPCWSGYEMIGMKSKNGRRVPNCVPVKKAKTGAIINLLKQAGEKILRTRGKGPKKGSVYQESKGTAQSGPVDKQLKSSSLSGDEMKVVDKKAKYVLDREANKPIQSIPTNKSEKLYSTGGKVWSSKYSSGSSKKGAKITRSGNKSTGNAAVSVKAYTGKAVKQPTETKKEFEMRHEYHTTYKHSKDYYKGLV